MTVSRCPDGPDLVEEERPRAASTLPSIRRIAVLWVPFSAPKSSLSTVGDGRAVQLDEGLRRLLGEDSWRVRAMAVFPVPLSPVMRTATGTGAATRTWRKTSARARLVPVQDDG